VRALPVDVPIVLGPFGGLSSVELTATVSELGGLGSFGLYGYDAERIERVDESTFRCYVYRFRFFALEVCPVLLVRVDEEPNGCCIRLLSCKASTAPPHILFASADDRSMYSANTDY
jgi:hypothetical protein